MASRQFLVDVKVDGKIEATGKVLGSNIGDKILFYTTRTVFPTTGEINTLYIANNTGFLYKWDTDHYVLIGSGGGETGYVNIDGGNANSVYTQWQKIDGGGA